MPLLVIWTLCYRVFFQLLGPLLQGFTLFYKVSFSILNFPIYIESCVFSSMVTGVFQITSRAKMHVNNVFLFFKNHFWHQHIKTIQNIQTILNFSKKKKLKFFEDAAAAAFPNVPYIPSYYSVLHHFIYFSCG
jgi:hypothetical protein